MSEATNTNYEPGTARLTFPDTTQSNMDHRLPQNAKSHLAIANAQKDIVAQAVDRLTSGQTQQRSSELSIINGDPSHANAIARIYNDSLPPGHQPGRGLDNSGRAYERSYLQVLTGEVLNAWISQHSAAGRPLWVAMRGGKAVGWLSFLGMSDRPGLACTSELALYVSKEAQRTGVGAHLVTAAISEAPSLGLDRLMVLVWGSNQASLSLFQRFGFKHWGCLPGAVWAHDISHDMVILGRHVEKTH
jgi:L-amino acid N-acyltransferase YncA